MLKCVFTVFICLISSVSVVKKYCAVSHAADSIRSMAAYYESENAALEGAQNGVFVASSKSSVIAAECAESDALHAMRILIQ